ncbi:methyltransferase [Marivirga lumbricoides]|uniref:Methyltransferase n=1 Tax=Marivirga lumbricoides TaxID=1046115 RepID=A0ABQ1N530_9BACT|nr:methyltransferase [Marivirga lumbricoides]
MKDRFSSLAKQYAQFRPGYPDEIFHFIQKEISGTKYAWDCGTGNGQVALKLASFMEQVEATDISEKQLGAATLQPNIRYSRQAAEQTDFPSKHFDLITVAQAIHWFEFDSFYREVARVLKPDGLFVVLGYGLLRVNKEVDEVLDRFYHDIIGDYWDPERKHIENHYQQIPFPFQEIVTPSLVHTTKWSLEHFLGYLQSWSAVKRYEEEKQKSPVLEFQPLFKKAWGDEQNQYSVKFPILFRAGKLK